MKERRYVGHALRTFSGEKRGSVEIPVAELAEQERTPARAVATSDARRRGILEDLLARSALLVIIYAVINVVYQQSYLNYLGFHVGLWPVATVLPLLTDFLVAFYAFILWVFLTRMPDRWFNAVAELFNLGTWRDWHAWLFRGVSICAVYLFLLFVSALDILRQKRTPLFWRDVLFPTQELFNQTWVLALFGLLSLTFMAILWYYRQIRRLGIRQVTPARRSQARMFLNGILPGGMLVLMAIAFLVAPSWYGRQRAVADLQKLARQGLQVVSDARLADSSSCRMSALLSGGAQRRMRVHFVGQLQNLLLFLEVQRLPPDTDLRTVPQFYPCLVSPSNVRSVELN